MLIKRRPCLFNPFSALAQGFEKTQSLVFRKPYFQSDESCLGVLHGQDKNSPTRS